MGWRSVTTAALVVGAIGFAAGRASSQDKAPSPEEMAKAMEEMATPGEQHKAMTAEAGVWDAEMSLFMDPTQPPAKTKGVSTIRSVNNGLYVAEDYTGEFMGKPYVGLGVRGFSKDKGQYFGIWCDGMTTMPEIVWGKADAAGKAVTFDGAETTMGGMVYTPRWVMRTDDADHRTFEHWTKFAGAPDFAKDVEIKYTRRK
jgi:hypothetical protein